MRSSLFLLIALTVLGGLKTENLFAQNALLPPPQPLYSEHLYKCTPYTRGNTGATGAPGEIGAIGPTGATGEAGTPAVNGPTGQAGPTGDAGPTGPSRRGDVGPIGDRGGTGATGRQGIMGPRGGPGFTKRGPTGPTGPTGTLSPGYGTFYTEISESIAAGDNVVFNTTGVANSDFVLLANGVIQINQTGDYSVIYGLAPTAATPSLTVALVLNGTEIMSSALGTGTQGVMETVSTYFEVTSTPSQIVLTNEDPVNTLNIAPAVGGDISAFITIKQLYTLPTP